jgi:TonB family protein
MPFDFSFRKGRKLFGVAVCSGILLAGSQFRASAREAIQRLSEDDVKVLKKVPPAYPPIARQLNLTGRVVIDLTISADGDVEKAEVVTGSPILGASAADAGKRWKFSPIKTDSGVKPVVRINFNFGVK